MFPKDAGEETEDPVCRACKWSTEFLEGCLAARITVTWNHDHSLSQQFLFWELFPKETLRAAVRCPRTMILSVCHLWETGPCLTSSKTKQHGHVCVWKQVIQKDAPDTTLGGRLSVNATNAGGVGGKRAFTRSSLTLCGPVDCSLIFDFIPFLTSPKFLQLIYKPYNERTNIGNVRAHPWRWKRWWWGWDKNH